MRSPRLKLTGCSAVYHCMSRVVGGEYLLDDSEKELFRKLLWRVAGFCGVELITHAEMSNHFHLLARVPPKTELDDPALAERVKDFYGRKSGWAARIDEDIAKSGKIAPQFRASLLARMGDISMFLKELKQRFTRGFNCRHERYGTLWAERFKSVLVEDQPGCVEMMAAYIDLNAVRAGLVNDPKDYRFCGYGEAAAGEEKARRGLGSCLAGKDWREKHASYRPYLFATGGESGHSKKAALGAAEIRAELKREGRLPIVSLLRLRVRYFTDGAVLGSREFVEEVFRKFRRHFGEKRQSGARAMAGGDWNGMRVLRALRQDVFG